jgi:transcriptional regulator with XRE-family HTH domain
MPKSRSHFGPWRLGWKFFGAELKSRREAAGMTQEQLGKLAFCSAGYIGQFEQAIRKPQLDHSKRFDEVFQTGGLFERMWRDLINESPYAHYFSDAAILEQQAESICCYQPLLVPGLLQTEAYARAIFHAAQPLLAEDRIAERVANRLARARVLKASEDQAAPLYWAVLDEGVIRRPVGGPEAMAEQLEHIARLARERRALIQVLPYSAGAHALLEGALTLMTFTDAPPVAYIEGPHLGQLIDDPGIIARNQMSYDLVRASALSPEKSLSLIDSVAEDYRIMSIHPDLSDARWRKSRHSGGNNGDCVEVAVNLPGIVPVRDSKNPGPTLIASRAAWTAFVRKVRS